MNPVENKFRSWFTLRPAPFVREELNSVATFQYQIEIRGQFRVKVRVRVGAELISSRE